MDLDQLKNLKIHQYKQSNGTDSVYIVTEPYSMSKSGDTLVVKPYAVDEVHYLDTNNHITIQRIAKENSNELIKIPINEIDKLVGKKRSISRPLSWLSTIAFIGVGASFILRMGNNDVRLIGNKVFLTSAPVLLLSWTLQATVAKKHYNFNGKGKSKWVFN